MSFSSVTLPKRHSWHDLRPNRPQAFRVRKDWRTGLGLAQASPSTSVYTTWSPDNVLAISDPTHDTDQQLSRQTPTGLSEQALLLALNERDLDGLQEFKGFGPKVAAKIMAFRDREKFFSSLDELVRVPLIGPTRFQILVGRASLFHTMPLHSTLRRPATSKISIRDLQPLNWPAPGVPRIQLGIASDAIEERKIAAEKRWFLTSRRVRAHYIYIHLSTREISGWAAHLVSSLPRVLRQILQTTNK